MKLVWHIIAKDLRRHQLPYGLWLCLLLAKQASIALGFSDGAADFEWFDRLQIGDTVLSVVENTVAFLLVGSWVMEDPLVGSTQFWITRPVSGRRLLAAKALGVGLLFVAMPLFVAASGWGACGLQGVELLRQAGLWLVVQSLLVAVAFTLGALSDRGNRFVVVVLGLVVAFVALTPVLSKLFAVYPETRALDATRTLVGFMLCAAAVVGAIWLQFTRRRVALGSAWLVAGVVLGVTAWNQFPFELFPGWRSVPDELPEAQGVELSVLRVQPASPSSHQKTPPGQSWIEVVYGVRNVPPNLVLSSASYGRFVFIAADGARHEIERSLVAVPAQTERGVRDALGVGSDATKDDPETKAKIERQIAETRQRRRDAIQKQLAEGKLTTSAAEAQLRGLDGGHPDSKQEATLTARMLAPVSVASQLANGGVTLETLLDVRFERLRLRGEQSLRNSESSSGDGYRARILPTSEEASRGHARRLTVVAAHGATGKRLLFCIVNRKICYVSPMNLERTSNFPVTFQMSRTNLNYTLPRLWRSGEWLLAPTVEDGLVLAMLTAEDVGLVRRSARWTNASSQAAARR